MNRPIYFLALFFIVSQPLFAQESGVPLAVDVSNRPTVLTLDFSTHDYELILYSFKTDEPDYNRTFNFVVTGAFGASKPAVFYADTPEHRTIPTDRDRLEYQLRQADRAIARRLQQTGGISPWRPRRRFSNKLVAPASMFSALASQKTTPPSQRPLLRPARMLMGISTSPILANCTPRVSSRTSTTLAQKLIPLPHLSLAKNPM